MAVLSFQKAKWAKSEASARRYFQVLQEGVDICENIIKYERDPDIVAIAVEKRAELRQHLRLAIINRRRARLYGDYKRIRALYESGSSTITEAAYHDVLQHTLIELDKLVRWRKRLGGLSPDSN